MVKILLVLAVFWLAQGYEIEVPKERSKVMCHLCVHIVKELEALLEHGGNVEKAADIVCKKIARGPLVHICEKVLTRIWPTLSTSSNNTNTPIKFVEEFIHVTNNSNK